MGGSISSNNISEVLTTLLSETCPPSHYVWTNFSIYNFATNNFSAENLNDLIKLRNRRPDNFAELIRFIIELFSNTAILSETTPKVCPELQLYCGTISLLLSISGLPVKFSPWFKTPALYLKSNTPLQTLLQTIYKLFNFSDDPLECLNPKYIEDRIVYAKTLLFLQHSQALTTIGGKDPSPYLQSFDGFPALQFLKSLIGMIPYAILHSKSQSALLYVNILMSLAVSSLYTCASWQAAISIVDQKAIHKAFSVLFVLLNSNPNDAINKRVIDSSDPLVSLFYTFLIKHIAFGKFIDINNLAPKYIVSLLILFQHKMETSTITFFHSIVLFIISHLTSNIQSLILLNEKFTYNPTTNYKPHHGTYADYIIEIITNPAVYNFVEAAPLIPISIGIIENLSSTTVNLSFFSANRIFILLTKFFTSKLAGRKEFVDSVQKLLLSILQFMRFHLLSNQSVILYGHEKRKIFKALSQSNVDKWKDTANNICRIIDASGEAIRIKDQKQRKKTLQNVLSPILSEIVDTPEEYNSFGLSNENEIIWYDWLRVIFWQLFPEEAEFYNLNFASFQMPNKASANTESFEMPAEVTDKVPQEKAFKEDAHESFQEVVVPAEVVEPNKKEHIEEIEVEKEEEEEERIKISEKEKTVEVNHKYKEEESLKINEREKTVEVKPKYKEEESALAIINSFVEETDDIKIKEQLRLEAEQEQQVREYFNMPVKHADTLEDLENPFGSDSDDEFAKFLED